MRNWQFSRREGRFVQQSPKQNRGTCQKKKRDYILAKHKGIDSVPARRPTSRNGEKPINRSNDSIESLGEDGGALSFYCSVLHLVANNLQKHEPGELGYPQEVWVRVYVRSDSLKR